MRKKKNDYLKRVCDSVGQLEMFRADAESGTVAVDLVRHTIRELFRHEFPDTRWVNGGLVNFSTDVQEGANEYSFHEMIHSGRAARITGNSDDIPAAEISGKRTLRPVHNYGIYITWSQKDIRRARMQGMFDVAQEKAIAAREGHDRTLDDLIRSGDPSIGLHGMVNHPGIQVANSATLNWLTATAAQIVDSFTAAVTGMINASDGVVVPNTALFPVAVYTRISTLQNSVASDITVLDYLKKAFPMITRWDWEHGLKSVSASGGSSNLIYRKDRSRQRVVMPMALKAYPPEQRGLEFRIYLESEFGGVMMPKPRDLLRLDGVGA